mgnify:CR=1 FL=1
MFSGIYEHVEDGGLSVLLLFGLLSIGMISVFSRPTVVRMWNRLLALYTPQWLCRIRSANSIRYKATEMEEKRTERKAPVRSITAADSDPFHTGNEYNHRPPENQ